MGQIFPVPPTPLFVAVAVGAAAAVTMLTLVFGVLQAPPEARATAIITATVVGGAVIGLMAFFTVPAFMAKVEVGGGYVRVNAWPWASLALKEDDVVRAFVVDWREDSPYRPKLRTFGASLGDYKAGWFSLANGGRALILSVRPVNLIVETKQGYYVILGPPDFEEFLKAFGAFHPYQ